MRRATASLCLLNGITMLVGGCGTAIPDMTITGPPEKEGLEEISLIQLIECELHLGVQNALDRFSAPGNDGHGVEWLRDWEAKLSLKVTVDEKGSFTPAVTYKDPLRTIVTQFSGSISQSFSASVGLQASSQATRSETIGFSYKFADLLAKPRLQQDSCKKLLRTKIVLNDLKIPDFIMNKALVANHTDTVINKGGESPYSTFTDDITFIVVYGGSVNPVWNLIHVTANANSPLYNAVRTKTHNLTITLGKVGSVQAANVNNAKLIGQAVAEALENR
jgi:hypothetical protein